MELVKEDFAPYLGGISVDLSSVAVIKMGSSLTSCSSF